MREILDRHDLHYLQMPMRWIDGIFLGNGDIGAMIYGDGKLLCFSLDKYDLWEERNSFQYGAKHTYEDLKKLIEDNEFNRAREKYQPAKYQPKEDPDFIYPTRLPVPRLEFQFSPQVVGFKGKLRLFDATASIKGRLGNSELKMDTFIHGKKNVCMLRIERTPIIRDFFTINLTTDHFDAAAREQLKHWGYSSAETGESKFGGAFNPTPYHYYVQNAPEGAGFHSYCIGYFSKFIRDHHLIIIVYISDRDHPKEKPTLQDYQKYLETEFQELLDANYVRIHAEHALLWRDYWEQSKIQIPDNIFENLYYIELYKLRCNSQKGKYPISLQGIWTIDGQMPPWSGDYHFDMNLQESYWGIFTSNHLELGEPVFRMLQTFRPIFEKTCQEFVGFQGAFARCAYSLGGNNVHGYYTTENWSGNGPFAAHLCWLYWKYTYDQEFLKDVAFPLFKGFFYMYSHLLEKNEFDEYILPVSNSPEFYENLPDAWGKNPNGDLALIRFLGKALLETIKVLDLQQEECALSNQIEDILENLIDFIADIEGLLVMEDRPLDISHRHHTHLLAIYPLGLLDIDAGEKEDEFFIEKSIRKVNSLGTWNWTGWSFPWMSLICARGQYRTLSYQYLRQYFNYIRENSMHVNGDSYNAHFSGHVYEPMTLEAGFCYIAAVLEMLLQSYNGIIRVFPSIPKQWQNLSFENLRAEGAFLVSAIQVQGHLAVVRIKSEKGNALKISNSFTTPVEQIDVSTGIVENYIVESTNYLELKTKPGETYEFRSSVHYSEVGKEKAEIKPIFTGKNFFGLAPKSANPYLPSNEK